MKNTETTTPIHDCRMLVSRTISRLMSTHLSGAAGMDEITLSRIGDAVLTHAADIVLGFERDRLDRIHVTTDAPYVVETAINRAGISTAQYERIAERKRDMIVRIVWDMLYEHLPDPDPEPDDLIVITAQNCGAAIAELEREREDAEAAALEEGMAESVTTVLRQYRHNARALSSATADSWARAQIAEEASRLVPPDADGERTPAWQRVHDEIRRRFNRFVIHVDDSEPLPDGSYEVFIKGWGGWTPAIVRSGGKTLALPNGWNWNMDTTTMVAAVRPAA